jgi:hypothetical protein
MELGRHHPGRILGRLRTPLTWRRQSPLRPPHDQPITGLARPMFRMLHTPTPPLRQLSESIRRAWYFSNKPPCSILTDDVVPQPFWIPTAQHIGLACIGMLGLSCVATHFARHFMALTCTDGGTDGNPSFFAGSFPRRLLGRKSETRIVRWPIFEVRVLVIVHGCNHQTSCRAMRLVNRIVPKSVAISHISAYQHLSGPAGTFADLPGPAGTITPRSAVFGLTRKSSGRR